MKTLIAGILSLTGALGLFVGKIGSIISLVVWALGLLGVISYVSFWWVTLFICIFLASLVILPIAVYLVR